MAVSDAKKKANAKWDSENMATLACKVKKDHADKFKAYCSEIGKTSNAVLRECVLSCIGEAMGESPQQPAGASQGEGLSLPLPHLKRRRRPHREPGRRFLHLLAVRLKRRRNATRLCKQ